MAVAVARSILFQSLIAVPSVGENVAAGRTLAMRTPPVWRRRIWNHFQRAKPGIGFLPGLPGPRCSTATTTTDLLLARATPPGLLRDRLRNPRRPRPDRRAYTLIASPSLCGAYAAAASGLIADPISFSLHGEMPFLSWLRR